MKDMQQSRMYQWEFTWRGEFESLDADGISWIIRHTHKELGLLTPKLTWRQNMAKKAYYRGPHLGAPNGMIALPADTSRGEWAWNELVILHEISHSIIYQWAKQSGTRVQGHGPEFMRVLNNLVEKYTEVDMMKFRQSQRDHGLVI